MTRYILGCIMVLLAAIGIVSMLSYCGRVMTCDERGDCDKYLRTDK